MPNQNIYSGSSFSLRNKVGRVLWGLVYHLFFYASPKLFHSWRILLLKLFGARVGKRVHVYPGVKIWAPWNLDLRDECGIGSGAILYSQAKITIGKRVVISQGAHLVAGTHDYNHPCFPLITKPITIGDYAWVAVDAFIHPGITIGEGCVIAARSVVIKDMPAWTVCAGHPCKPLKIRDRAVKQCI